MRDITKIIIHCSDSGITGQTAAMINYWHSAQPPLGRGWKMIGYHFFCGFTGYMEQGRPLEMVGAHCEGHNDDSIGICLAGKKISDFRPAQFDAVKMILRPLKLAFPNAAIHPHNFFNPNKTCPVFDIAELELFWNSLYNEKS